MIAIVFPGQGSQKPGMGRELVEAHAAAAETFDRASAAVSQDLRALCFESDEDTLRQTQNAQLALFVCGVAAWRALEDSDADLHRVMATAGHSVGEYAALTAAGVVSLEDGARLVKTRGELMARAGERAPGTMAAVLGLDADALNAVCAEAEGTVVVANDNCPGQLVISGETEAVRRASELAQARGAKRVLPLNVSGAFHSPLMEEPSREMGSALRAVTFHSSPLRVYANVTAEPVADSNAWPELLEAQLRQPVRWTETTRHLVRDGVNTFIECGGGTVLGGLIGRIDKGAKRLAVGDAASFAETVAALSA